MELNRTSDAAKKAAINYSNAPTVYTFYDGNMRPIYSGKSDRFSKRLAEHYKTSKWYPKAVYVGLKQYPTLSDMNVAEVITICNKKPQENILCNHNDTFSVVTAEDPVEEVILKMSELPLLNPSNLTLHVTIEGCTSSNEQKDLWMEVLACQNPEYSRYQRTNPVILAENSKGSSTRSFRMVAKGEQTGFLGFVSERSVPKLEKFLKEGIETDSRFLGVRIVDSELKNRMEVEVFKNGVFQK